MEGFRHFLEANADKEAQESIEKLPKKHRALLKGYKFKFEGGCNLKGYPDSIGLIHLDNPQKKVVQVAAPWNYGREFAMLHEVGHKVYEKLMDKKLRKEWAKVAAKTRPALKKHDKSVASQNDEELFCHAYSQHFVKNKVLKYQHKEWDAFIEKIS